MGDQGKPHPLTQAPPSENGKGLLACGCDPTAVEKPVRGRKNTDMFGPGMGMYMQWCAQCKEPLDFGLVQSESEQTLITKPTGIM